VVCKKMNPRAKSTVKFDLGRNDREIPEFASNRHPTLVGRDILPPIGKECRMLSHRHSFPIGGSSCFPIGDLKNSLYN
jgi:hypothetical protein